MQIKVSACKLPSPERLLRKLDGTFVKGLKARMKADLIAPGIPPLALQCTDIARKEDFLPHLANQYSYEVQGGLHTISTKKRVIGRNARYVPSDYQSSVTALYLNYELNQLQKTKYVTTMYVDIRLIKM